MAPDSCNPYASPQSALAELLDPTQRPGGEERPFLRAFARWTLICTLSAAPSFFWGCMMHPHPMQLGAMLLGVATYIVAYTAVDCSEWRQWVVSDRFRRRTVLIGYGTRLLISIIFPIGIVIDMMLGTVAVSLIQRSGISGPAGVPADQAALGVVYLTTLLQGALLNALLFAYMVCVWSVQRFLAAAWHRSK